MVALLADKAAVLIEHPCDAAGHAGAEVLSGAAQHQDSSAGHVFAAVVAYTFDDSGGARIAHGETLAGTAGGKEAARGGAIERDIAEQDVVRALTRSIALGAKHDLTPAEAFADKIVGQAFEDETHARNGEGAKGLTGDALQLNFDGRHWVAVMQPLQSELACNTGADGTVTGRDFTAHGEGLPLTRSGERGFQPVVVHGCIGLRALVALPGPRAYTIDRRREHAGEIERADTARLLKQIGAAYGIAQAREAKPGEHAPQIASEAFKKADDVLRLAAEFCTQLGLLRGDAGRTGVEVTLPRHVATDCDQHRGAEGVFVRAEHRGDQDIARRLQAAIAAQTHAAAQAIG